MRLVLQRVSQASVTVAGECVGAIGSGVLVLVGIGHRDAEPDVQWAVKRILDTKVTLTL
jgi:D-tyrosyl-tRNA(Tyr) deacylase